ncbi:CocE/NonD family hydrolase [Actinomadura madurae]|uniref:CocE/NonD family hydrolase n=1 Tax=Actinomadura madurae TaxID=1993 RepID=UPI003999CC06
MRDGTRLYADVYRPNGTGTHPAILVRTPYPRNISGLLGVWPLNVAAAGFALVVQNVRGRFGSEGEFVPFVNEEADGFDSIAWCAEQPWSDGRVFTLGNSYLGLTQSFAAASSPPALSGMAVGATPWDGHADLMYCGGAFQLGYAMFWAHIQAGMEMFGSGKVDPALLEQWGPIGDEMDSFYRHTPLNDVPVFDRLIPAWRTWLEHPARDEYWRALSLSERESPIRVPAIITDGWFDLFLKGTLDTFKALRADEATRDNTRLIIGPWSQANREQALGELDFGPGAAAIAVQLDVQYLNFFRECLGEGGPVSGAPVKLFVMGANVWRDEQEWPLERAVTTKYYLHSGGGLSAERPLVEATPSTYVYDPRDPVPTVGGATSFQGEQVGANCGPRDQRAVEERPDVVCFSTEVLDEDIEVTGPVEVVLHAASSAVDTDWTAKLVDVHPDGRAMSVADGILRARYREGFERPVLMKPGTPYRFVIDLVATSMVFKAGHRIRVEISSSNFPRFDRNPNTGRLPAEELETNMISAEQTLFHDAARPSWIALPIVPA